MNKTTKIFIPDYDGIGQHEIEVQRPKIMTMMAQGKIPNELMSAAVLAVNGSNSIKEKETLENQAKTFVNLMDLYCRVCIVNPAYEDFIENATDEQVTAIYLWAISGGKDLEKFRIKKENDTDNSNGEVLQEKTK